MRLRDFCFEERMPSARYHETGKFEYVNTGGYYHSLPGDPLRDVYRYDGGSAARDGLPE